LTTLVDHKVTPLTRLELKRLAQNARRFFGVPEVGYFNVIDCIRALGTTKQVKGELLDIRFFNSEEGQSPAYVKYNPLRLYYDKEFWELADLGDPYSRYIASHELCHIFAHDSDAQPYSGVRRKWIDFEELSAEWQANTFADHFLLSDGSIARFIFPRAIANNCFVEREVVVRRLGGGKVNLTGECCPECGSDQVYRSGMLMCCGICDWTLSR
jgi:hypothetical protein